MNYSIIFTAFILFNVLFSHPISRKEYYEVFKSNSITDMELMANKINNTQGHKAYLGALKMKMSGLQKGPSSKLKTFKEGRELLEAEIKKDPTNIEWHFLRLAVQENAPKIVKYSSNLTEDHNYIISHFSSAPIDLKIIIKAYADSSSGLKISDLK